MPNRNTSRPMYYDMDGKPMEMMAWARSMNNPEKRRVGFTKLPNKVEVSTVLLGLDHNYMREGPPLIFESMVFIEGENERVCERYSTKEEAKAGHDRLVKMYTPVDIATAKLMVRRPQIIKD